MNTYLSDTDRLNLLKIAISHTNSQLLAEWVPAYAAVYTALGMSPSEQKSRVIPSDTRFVIVDGVTWYTKAKPSRSRSTQRKSAKHRLFVDCPVCEKAIPAGRLHQHARVHAGSGVRGAKK